MSSVCWASPKGAPSNVPRRPCLCPQCAGEARRCRHHHRAVGLSARLHQHLRPRCRAAGCQADRSRARLDAQRLHRRGDLREGRALRRAHPSSRPADEAAAPGRPQGLQAVRGDLLVGRARHRGRAVHRQGAPARQRNDLAVLLRRHDGAGAARRHQPAAPHDEVFALVLDHLRDAVRYRLDRRRRRQARRRCARGRRAFRAGGDLGRQPGEHPGQRHDPRHEGQEAWRQAGRGRSLPHRHSRPGRYPSRGEAGHRWCAGGRRHARPLQGGLCRLGLPPEVHRRAGRAGRPCGDAHAGMGVEDHRPLGRGDRELRAALRADQGRVHPLPSRLQPQPQWRGEHARRDLPAGRDRRVEVQGRRRALRPHRHVPDQEDPDRRDGHDRHVVARTRPVATWGRS